MDYNVVIALFKSAIAIATVFLLGCTGEIIMEKAGHLNLGIPGVLCFGIVGGCSGVSMCMSMYAKSDGATNYFVLLFFALFFSILFSCIAGLIYGVLTVTLKCNQNVTGLAITTFGAGFANFFVNRIDSTHFATASKIIKRSLPFADELGWFGKIFLSHGILVYLGIAIAIIAAIIIKKTRIGLNLRAVGENPATADAAGINVELYKYAAILIGSSVAGLGGLFYMMDFVNGLWENSSTIQAHGWLALALVIFTVWKPSLAIFGSFIFGFLFILPSYLNISSAEMEVLRLVPYIVTIIVLIVTSIVGKKSVQPPEALGLPYFREDR